MARKPQPPESPDKLASRQREHRLRERVWPQELPPANADPWQMCDQALDALDRIGARFNGRGGAVAADLELAAELIRQLAVGPDLPGTP